MEFIGGDEMKIIAIVFVAVWILWILLDRRGVRRSEDGSMPDVYFQRKALRLIVPIILGIGSAVLFILYCVLRMIM